MQERGARAARFLLCPFHPPKSRIILPRVSSINPETSHEPMVVRAAIAAGHGRSTRIGTLRGHKRRSALKLLAFLALGYSSPGIGVPLKLMKRPLSAGVRR